MEGLAQEPDKSIWLIIPAAELAAGIPGYHRYYNGAVGQVEAAMVVAIRTDAGAREFARLRQRNWEDVAARLAEGADLRPDTSGLLRLVHSKGPPQDGSRSIYLFPNKASIGARRAAIAPSCLADLDFNRQERYRCS